MSKAVMVVAVILGIAFLGLTAGYWLVPAGSLPHYLPGFVGGSTHVRFKHGLGTLLLAFAFLAVTWFQSGPKKGSA
jgi:hypothetical protein